MNRAIAIIKDVLNARLGALAVSGSCEFTVNSQHITVSNANASFSFSFIDEGDIVKAAYGDQGRSNADTLYSFCKRYMNAELFEAFKCIIDNLVIFGNVDFSIYRGTDILNVTSYCKHHAVEFTFKSCTDTFGLTNGQALGVLNSCSSDLSFVRGFKGIHYTKGSKFADLDIGECNALRMLQQILALYTKDGNIVYEAAPNDGVPSITKVVLSFSEPVTILAIPRVINSHTLDTLPPMVAGFIRQTEDCRSWIQEKQIVDMGDNHVVLRSKFGRNPNYLRHTRYITIYYN